MLVRFYQFYKSIFFCSTLNYIQLMCLINQLLLRLFLSFIVRLKLFIYEQKLINKNIPP